MSNDAANMVAQDDLILPVCLKCGGPDYEGQVRRLRSSDGVFFTKAGAIKLARYVEQELSRYMSNRVPVALPSGPFEATPSESRRPSDR